jgi:hypothetical protein
VGPCPALQSAGQVGRRARPPPDLHDLFSLVPGRLVELIHVYVGQPVDFVVGFLVFQKLLHRFVAIPPDPEGAGLAGERRRFLAKTVDDFRRHGANLFAPSKKRLEEIDVELTQLTTRFSENVLDSTS